MDPFMARTMVESLSKGLNPLTGRVLPPGDVCANEDVQDALLEVLAHCAIESSEQYLVRIKEEKALARKERRAEMARRYPRSGEAWSADEERKLWYLYRQGANIYQIANTLKRSPGAVEAKQRQLQSKVLYRSKK